MFVVATDGRGHGRRAVNRKIKIDDVFAMQSDLRGFGVDHLDTTVRLCFVSTVISARITDDRRPNL